MRTSKPLAGSKWRRQIRDNWDGAADGWERWEPFLLHTLGAVNPALIRGLELRPGSRVLDLACGMGEPALTIAQLVGPRGHVTGIDVSERMLSLARERARLRGIRNVGLKRGDMEKVRTPQRGYDGIVCRFGLFFVEDVAGTLQRVRRCLKPGGHAAFAVWGPLERNAWWKAREEAIAPWIEEEDVDHENIPHPIRLAPRGRLARLMREAGFRRVKTEEVEVPFVLPNIEGYWQMTTATSGTMRRLLGELSKAEQGKVRRRVLRSARGFRVGNGLCFPGMAWVVTGAR